MCDQCNATYMTKPEGRLVCTWVVACDSHEAFEIEQNIWQRNVATDDPSHTLQAEPPDYEGSTKQN